MRFDTCHDLDILLLSGKCRLYFPPSSSSLAQHPRVHDSTNPCNPHNLAGRSSLPRHNLTKFFAALAHPSSSKSKSSATQPPVSSLLLLTLGRSSRLSLRVHPNMSWEIGFDLGLAGFTTDARSMLPEGPPQKRRKIQLACNCCRMRKTRCDGRRPICSSCERRGSGEGCLYEEGTSITHKYVVSPRASP